MSNTKKLTVAFVGGVVTPEFWGQIGDAKFQTGVAKCENMIVLPHGPVTNRPGFAFVRAVKFEQLRTRLIPFTYSTTQTMVLEFGHGYIRFHTGGETLLDANGNVYEIVTPYPDTSLFDIHYVQSADVLTLVHPNHPPAELRRMGATNWVLSNISFASTLAPPANINVASNAKGQDYTYRYVVTASDASGNGMESAASQEAGGYTSHPIASVTNSVNGAILFEGDIRNALAVGSQVTISGVEGMTEINGTDYVISHVSYSKEVLANDFVMEDGTPVTIADPGLLRFFNVFAKMGLVPAQTRISLTKNGIPVITTNFAAHTGGGTLSVKYGGVKNNLFITGAKNDISWNAVAGAARYDVYKFQGGLFGFIGQSTTTSFTDDNISPNLGKTPPVYDLVMYGPGKYPGAVSYFEQRRCFAGSTAEPQNLRMTKTGTESNMSYSLPIRDDDAINIRVAAREANTIRHIVPMANMVLLTSAAEWRVTSVNSDAITPTSISVKPQSYVGANNVQPVIVNNNIIYSASRGGHLREMAFNFQAGGYATGDLSLRAPHLFDGFDIVDLAYTKAPWPIVWAVSTSGSLIGMTYIPEQQLGAMHEHVSKTGKFESCCVVAEGPEDVLYVVVERMMNGHQRRYVERMRPRAFATASDAFFVDSGGTYDGPAVNTITGLHWLEGQTVSVLGDGAVMTQKLVVGGSIELESPCSKVQVGLPITAQIHTLPLSAQVDAAFGQGRLKNLNKVWVRVHKSSGVFAGPSLNKLTEFKQRTTEVYGAAPSLVTGEIEITLDPTWQSGGQIFILQNDPLPLTVVALTVEAALGG